MSDTCLNMATAAGEQASQKSGHAIETNVSNLVIHRLAEGDIVIPIIITSLALIVTLTLVSFVVNPLNKIPGPRLFALTKWRLALEDWNGTRTRTIDELHRKYGPIVRIGPSEVSCNSSGALRTIYGAGSGFERPAFYRMFDVYGKQHMFTFHTSTEHARRKKLLSSSYSKSTVLKSPYSVSIESKARDYLDLIESDPATASEVSRSLRYFSLDNITWVVFGDAGATSALTGNSAHRALLHDDISEAARRRLSWFQIHLPRYSTWAMRTRVLGLCSLLHVPNQITHHSLEDYAWQKCMRSSKSPGATGTIPLGGIFEKLNDQGKENLSILDIAAECADHIDAGLSTTASTLMFALWTLSLFENASIQTRLAEEVSSPAAPEDLNQDGILTVEACDKLPFLDAVIKETLRLFSPIPASQPRTSPNPVEINGYTIPAGTVVQCQPYSLHRNEEVFPEPLRFSPDRWLASPDVVSRMKRWWWPFSSGARMCIGMK